MPLVVINHVRAKAVKTGWHRHVAERAAQLGKEMPRIVAKALNTPENPDGKLTSYDIEVWHRKGGYSDVCGDNVDLEIIIWANDFPERRATLEYRQKNITEEISRVLLGGDIRGSVWVLLAPGSFGTF